MIRLRLESDGRRTLVELGWLPGQLNDFCNALAYSADASIDAFLEKRPDFMNIGKTCMAVALIACEQMGLGSPPP